MIPFEDLNIEGEKHFKLRAECMNDVLFLYKKMPKIWGINIVQWGPMPDVELEFKTTLSSDEILAILKKRVDGHVMIDTLKPYD
jgi:hypothetical protein